MMSSKQATIPEVINELMFVAISQPDAVDINVEYSGVTDLVGVQVMPAGFDYANTTIEQYRAAKILAIDVSLKVPGALNILLNVKEQLLALITAVQEVAA